MPTVNGDIDNIGTSLGTGEHTAHCDTSSIVRVHVDGKIRVSLSNSANEPSC